MRYLRPDSPLTWGLWRTAPDYPSLREAIADFLEAGRSEHRSDIHPAEQDFAQAMAFAAHSGYLPLQADRWPGQRAMVEGVVTESGTLGQLQAAAGTEDLTPVVHHRDRPGDIDGIDGAPVTLARHRELARLSKNPRRLGAARLAPDMTDLWQVTIVGPENRLVRALDAFSGRVHYAWSPTGPVTVNTADLSGSGCSILTPVYTRAFAHPGIPGASFAVHHYATHARDGRYLVLRAHTLTTQQHRATMHEFGTLGTRAARTTLADADQLARDLAHQLTGNDIDWDGKSLARGGCIRLRRNVIPHPA
jgi:hypothetical protein